MDTRSKSVRSLRRAAACFSSPCPLASTAHSRSRSTHSPTLCIICASAPSCTPVFLSKTHAPYVRLPPPSCSCPGSVGRRRPIHRQTPWLSAEERRPARRHRRPIALVASPPPPPPSRLSSRRVYGQRRGVRVCALSAHLRPSRSIFPFPSATIPIYERVKLRSRYAGQRGWRGLWVRLSTNRDNQSGRRTSNSHAFFAPTRSTPSGTYGHPGLSAARSARGAPGLSLPCTVARCGEWEERRDRARKVARIARRGGAGKSEGGKMKWKWEGEARSCLFLTFAAEERS
ncbi:hypothetical protein B0H14DRAFT_2806126 [Mycena olivaceomarginata]|nr:hypothetical protein B0H14DRAFT_2806126 [Mycena olivaceomarginata]